MKNEIKPLKSSFPPISQPDAEILILGSLPGERSLEMQQYYGHAQNKFWKIIAAITGNELPQNYSDKIQLLHKNKIALWDVIEAANRTGSLDSAINNEIPNDLQSFIKDHSGIKTIAFNGRKAAAVFYKYFKVKEGIKYILLPSSSPANARMGMKRMVEVWRYSLFE